MDQPHTARTSMADQLSPALSPRAPAFVRTPTFCPPVVVPAPSRSEQLRDRILAAQGTRDLPVVAVAALTAPAAPVTASQPLIRRILATRAARG